eukprot:jgi/Ulvmu1/6926/UM032_0004.1
MAAKSVKSLVRLLVPAGQAKPAPPVGPALGQAGLNIMSFCKDFNARTDNVKPGIKLPVKLTAYTDKTFEYKVKLPPISHFLQRAAGVPDGAAKPGDQIVGTVSLKHIYEIARVKQQEDREVSMESWCRQVIGCARSMGVRVVTRPEDA